MTATDLVGYVAGILLALSFAPQVVKTFRVKHADDVSMGMLLLSLWAAIGYEIYSWRLQLWPVVVMNGVFLVLVAIKIILKTTYDRRNGAQLPQPELRPDVEREPLN